MTEPFHYKPLKELIKEWENDPAKKKMLQGARDKLVNDVLSVQPMPDIKFNLRADIAESVEQEDD